MMRAMAISEPGGPDVLRQVSRNIPSPNRNEVVIKIAYAGVNRPDVLQRLGSYLPPSGPIQIVCRLVVPEPSLIPMGLSDYIASHSVLTIRNSAVQ